MKCDRMLEDHFLGTVTVGERGQVVIPADARKKFNVNPGDKLLVMEHPAGGIVLCKIDAMRDFFSTFIEDLERLESKVAATGDENNGQ